MPSLPSSAPSIPHALLNPDKAIPTLNRCAEFGKMHVTAGRLPFANLPRF